MGFNCTFYNLCFFLYVFIVPAFLQYLMRAPSTFNSAPFHPVPLPTLQGKVAHVNMSTPPQTMETNVNHCRPCYEDKFHKHGMYQWDIMLRMSYQDLVAQTSENPVSTMYPVIMASQDFKRWKVVADADDVAGAKAFDPKNKEPEPTHISPPLLIANLKPFGCVDNETGTTDPFQWFFASSGKAKRYKWKLVEHISMHGSVNLVACVMKGFAKVNRVMSYYAQNCIHGTEMKCQMTTREALGQCFALGSACGQACGFFSPGSKHCEGGVLDPQIFDGLTTKRVSIKTASGGGASNALVNCERDPCSTGLHFKDMYVEAENPNDFVVGHDDEITGDYYTLMFAMSDLEADEMIAGAKEMAEEKASSGSSDKKEADADDEDGDDELALEAAADDELKLASHSRHHRRKPSSDDEVDERRLAGGNKFNWQLAHVPNLTIGVMKDHASNTMRIHPTRESCYTQPGFAYIVACMTAKPVYTSGQLMDTDGPPFNDRCLAVGGLCGATCGSGETLDDNALSHCPLGHGVLGRRLAVAGDSPYATVHIPKEHLIAPIEPRKSATTHSVASRFFFHGFIYFMVISYVATLLSKFPGNFTDFYPIHTWDEIRTHGYVMEKFGCAVAWGVSASENKMIVFRNWIGKIAARPQFDDAAFPTFKRWVDVFADEGHREGARILWLAWTNFLDTNPPLDFLEEWSTNIRELTWEQASQRSPFDIAWKDDKLRKVLPVTAQQALNFLTAPGEEVPEGGVELQQDSLTKLIELADVFKSLPENLKMEPTVSMPRKDDVVLTREVSVGRNREHGKKVNPFFSVKYSRNWKSEVDKQCQERSSNLGMEMADYQKCITVTDKSGKKLSCAKLDEVSEQQFPLHFREPPSHRDRKVYMVYASRAKPETDRKGIEKTRTLDKYLWACLRPSAVRPYGSGGSGTRRTFSKSALRSMERSEKDPLLADDAASRASSQSHTDSSNGNATLVREIVAGVVSRHNKTFLEGLADIEEKAWKAKPGSWSHRQYAEEYLKFRVLDSDWELGRYCYGEIVGEDVDVDGDAVLILDNPSPALLELIGEIQTRTGNGSAESSATKGMGMVAMETVNETSCGCLNRTVARVAYAVKPSLDFFFSNTDDDDVAHNSKEVERIFKQKLRQFVNCSEDEFKKFQVTQTPRGADLIVEVTGPGKLIEEIRDRATSNIMVMNYQGRIMDNHPTVLVKKKLLMPYCGVRGKGGGLNFAVDLLQFRDGFVGTGSDADPTPHRMLFGIFDARHQPHPDFWRMVLPKFVQNKDIGFTYEVNDDIAMVQAPQSFAGLRSEDDVLDILNGAAFNIMNVIRNRCGGVTSCGTNAVWLINGRDFSRQKDDDVNKEFFESRTKIEDTATTHIHFCNGKRSVYVHEKVSTGVAKVNADYLGAVQRWAEGAVQLFWVQLFVDKTLRLVIFGWMVIAFTLMLFWMLYGSWAKELFGYNVFCDVEGTSTLVFGTNHGFCQTLYDGYAVFLHHNIDRVIYTMAIDDYMRMLDVTISWFCVVCAFAFTTFILAWRGSMPPIVRTFIMMENISYWLTSCSTFFWMALTVFMVVGKTPPLMFNVSHFALYVLGIKVTEHCMLNYYKSLGEADELSIWRGQQSYMISAPLYIMSIVQGTFAAWGITWRNLDKSFWNASDHGAEVIRAATVWVTFIWIMFFFCIAFTIVMSIRYDLFHEYSDKFQRQCQLGACWMMMLLAITVWEPLLNFWGFDKTIDKLSKDESRYFIRWWASFNVWWRSRAWIVRYFVDFGLPVLILSGATGAIGLLNVIAYATTAQGLRI